MAGSKQVLGLDIGHHAVKAVVASAHGQRLRVHKLDRFPIPQDLPDPGSAILKWLQEHKLESLPIVTSISGSRVLYQHVVLEDEDPRSPEQVAAVEAARFHEMTDSRMVFTATPASVNGKERRLLISLVRPDLLEMSLGPVTQGGLKLINALPAPIALFNGVISLGEPIHRPTLFADLGATNTEVAIGSGSGLLFARSFSLGTELLTNAFAAHFGVSIQEGERRRLLNAELDQLPAEIREACTRFAQHWHEEIQACIQMYRRHTGDAEDLQKLLLSGGGSLWKPLTTLLQTGSPIRIATVGRIHGQEQKESAEFQVAAGLAASGLGIGRATASLLPEAVRNALVRERSKKYWFLTGVCSLAAMGMLLWSSKIGLVRQAQRLQQQNSVLARCSAIGKQIDEIRARSALLDDMMRPLATYVNNSARIRDLTLFIAENKGPRDFITLISDSQTYIDLRVRAVETRRRDRNARIADTQPLKSAAMNRLIVEGFTPSPNLASVKQLIERLRTHEQVLRADLLSDDMVFVAPETDGQWEQIRARRFVLDVQLKDPAGGPK